jgi:cytochrome P450
MGIPLGQGNCQSFSAQGQCLPRTLSRASGFQHFKTNPLGFLARARSRHGDLFVVRDAEPIFSRASSCAGVIAVFGTELQRAVLSDIESFGMPVSAAQCLNLSPKLTNLNRGLHSMYGHQHATQKRLLMAVLNSVSLDVYLGMVWAAFVDLTGDWSVGSKLGLLSQMRELMLQASARVLFGERHVDNSAVVLLLGTYFQLRREASFPRKSKSKESLKYLTGVGNSLDMELRKYVRDCRRNSTASFGGLLAKLATLELEHGRLFSEDEVVGHSNVLFVSSTEPVAVALTWILLILSQLPSLRNDLRSEIATVLEPGACPTVDMLGRLPLLDGVINESLRLLPPNAFMVRITTRPASLNGAWLPECCEVILCPFLAHRDKEVFRRPGYFVPERWKDICPSPFEYFPFGAGGHSCIGRILASYLIKVMIAFLLPRYDLVLAGDQDLDWRLNIMFMPSRDPEIEIQPLDRSSVMEPRRLRGPISKLIKFTAQQS